MAPIIPFLTEYVWQNMVREIEPTEAESVILSGFAKKIGSYNFEDYINYASIAQRVMTLANHLRAENNLKVKQPLLKMFIVSDSKYAINALNEYQALIKDEINVKEAHVTDNVEEFNTYYLGLNFKNAGRILKGDVQKVKMLLEQTDDITMKKYVAEFDAGSVEIAPYGRLSADLFVKNSKPKQEFVLGKDGDLTVVLDIELNETLINEGILREIIRNAQILRKEANFNIDARIMLSITTDNEKLAKILNDNEQKIMSETLATSFNQDFHADIQKTIILDEGALSYKLKSID